MVEMGRLLTDLKVERHYCNLVLQGVLLTC